MTRETNLRTMMHNERAELLAELARLDKAIEAYNGKSPMKEEPPSPVPPPAKKRHRKRLSIPRHKRGVNPKIARAPRGVLKAKLLELLDAHGGKRTSAELFAAFRSFWGPRASRYVVEKRLSLALYHLEKEGTVARDGDIWFR